MSLRSRPGTVLGLVGPNGSGKTTLYRLILGLMDPLSGRVSVGGQRPARYRRQSGIGYLPEQVRLPPALKVVELGQFVGALAGLPRDRIRRTIDALLSDLALEGKADSKIGTLSHGYRQRVGLLAALIGDPELLLLDEPANGLDPTSVGLLRSLVRGLRRAGRTVIVSSHNLTELERLCDSMVILRSGRVLGRIAREDLVARRDVWVLQIVPDGRSGAAVASPGTAAVRLAADEFAFEEEKAAIDFAARLREGGVTVEGLERRRYDLEFLFHSLLRKEEHAWRRGSDQ